MNRFDISQARAGTWNMKQVTLGDGLLDVLFLTNDHVINSPFYTNRHTESRIKAL